MMGMDQDDIVLAPWTTIKFRVSGANLSSANQSARRPPPPAARQGQHVSNLYPGTTALYVTPHHDPAGQQSSTDAFHQRE